MEMIDPLKIDLLKLNVVKTNKKLKTYNGKCCGGYYNAYLGEYDCEYNPIISCEECKYSGEGGRKDPEAKRNQRRDK